MIRLIFGLKVCRSTGSAGSTTVAVSRRIKCYPVKSQLLSRVRVVNQPHWESISHEALVRQDQILFPRSIQAFKQSTSK